MVYFEPDLDGLPVFGDAPPVDALFDEGEPRVFPPYLRPEDSTPMADGDPHAFVAVLETQGHSVVLGFIRGVNYGICDEFTHREHQFMAPRMIRRPAFDQSAPAPRRVEATFEMVVFLGSHRGGPSLIEVPGVGNGSPVPLRQMPELSFSSTT